MRKREKEKRSPTSPGKLIQIDPAHFRPVPAMGRGQFTVIDLVSRARSRAQAGKAMALLEEVLERMLFQVQATQFHWWVRVRD